MTQTPIQQFNTDFEGLTSSITKYQNLVNEHKTIYEDYQKSFDQMFNKIKNPDLLMMLLMYMLANGGINVLNSNLAITGSGTVDILTNLTKCGNDIQNIVDVDPKAHPHEAASKTTVVDVAIFTTKMLETFSAENPNGYGNVLQRALGASGVLALHDNYLKIRQEIFYPGNPLDPNNPEAKYNPSSGFSFDPTSYNPLHPQESPGKDFITTFAQMRELMQSKDDKLGATQAYQTMTNAFNSNTTSTQSVQAGVNEQITLDTNAIKALQSFIVAIMHSIVGVEKATIQHIQG